MSRPRVVIVGLGPAGPECITAAVSEALQRIRHRFVRTERHPSAHVVGEATSFDDIYESAATFDEVYTTIAGRLVEAAQAHGEIVYAVPGSPLVLERTVRYLLDDERIECQVLPALSFLDLAYAALRIDPIEVGLRLIDGHQFVDASAGHGGALLVAHCHANWVLSDIKLAVENASGDEPVVILQRLGSPDELITHTTWAELDRTVEADHLTSIYIPSLGAPVAGELASFHEIVRRLRAECPWDREQTHQSLAKYAIEETYELVEAISQLTDDSDDDLIGELGDVLLQVVLHSAIAEEEGRFTLADVAARISEKMVRRHPHVFGDVAVDSANEVAENWQRIKSAEKQDLIGGPVPRSALDAARPGQPTLRFAAELLGAAAATGFDYDDPQRVLDKVAEELDEVRERFDDTDSTRFFDEAGDLLLATVAVCRVRAVDPDLALRQASTKFADRFRILERLAGERTVDLATCGEGAIIELWRLAKSELDRDHPRG